MLYLALEAVISGIIVAARLPFWLALVAGCALAAALYGAMTWIGPRYDLRL